MPTPFSMRESMWLCRLKLYLNGVYFQETVGSVFSHLFLHSYTVDLYTVGFQADSTMFHHLLLPNLTRTQIF